MYKVNNNIIGKFKYGRIKYIRIVLKKFVVF